MATNSPLFNSVDPNIKPKAEEKLACDGCPNALAFALKDEVRFYCKVMHTITWTSTERTAIVVCTDNIVATEPVQQTPQTGKQEVVIDDYQEFDPETKPFINPK